MIAKLKCAMPKWMGGGHMRGKFHGLLREQGGDKVIAKMFICPRCDTTWTRKAKA